VKNPLLTPEIRELLDAGDLATLVEICTEMHPRTVAEVLGDLETRERLKVLSPLPASLRADIVSEMDVEEQSELADEASAKELASFLDEMLADDRVDFVQRLDPGVRDQVLPLLERAAREDVKRLLAQAEGTVGARMNTDFAKIPPGLTASQAIGRLRQQASRKETIYYSYVVDADDRMLGVVSLKELVLARPEAPVSDIMSTELVSVRASEDQEAAAKILNSYDLLALPVVDDQHRIVGILTYDDVADIVQAEATEDIARIGAVAAGAEDRTYLRTGVADHVRRRLGWIVVLAFLQILTSWVIGAYEGAIGSALILAAYIPMVMATGGNIGAQSSTVLIRSIALGQVGAGDWWRVAVRELSIAAVLAVATVSVAFVKVYFFTSGSQVPAGIELWHIALVVGAAVAAQTLTSAVVGGLLPIGAKAVGIDPAVVATPAITTIVDVSGLVIYFSMAVRFLGLAT
jgi:magnesium transporter